MSPDETENARALMVARFGVSCAAWLVWAHRRQLRRAGVVDLVIPGSADTPMWFALAVEYLRGRAHWAIDVLAQGDVRTFRLRWLVKRPYTLASA